jgi:uncharacterized protein DUF4349
MARLLCWALVLGLLVAVGCAREASGPPGAEAPAGQFKEDAGPAKKKETVARKIIYKAQVEVIVEDFEKASADLLRLVKERPGAYVAGSDVQGTPGSPRVGVWTVRVPVDHFDAFLVAVGALGELRHSNTDSQDITDAYYDLQAHIKNDEVREKGLQKLYLERASGSKLEDLLAVDRELSAVRGKIDAQKGQMQRWDKETALATAVVTLRDRRAYVPPLVPDFGTSVGRTFQASVEALVTFGKFLILAAVALAPWLAVLAVVAVPGWRFGRRYWKKAAEVQTVTPAEEHEREGA